MRFACMNAHNIMMTNGQLLRWTKSKKPWIMSEELFSIWFFCYSHIQYVAISMIRTCYTTSFLWQWFRSQESDRTKSCERRVYWNLELYKIRDKWDNIISFRFSTYLNKMVDMDESLMVFVNILGVITFTSIVVYHLITATAKDAEI